MICIDPWEHHCVECGEPYCYQTCPKYRPARTGRCERFEDGRFLAWGKLELLWHGRMADPWARSAMLVFNAAFEPIALALGARVYRVFRSVRWRLGRLLARHQEQPSLWRITCSSESEAKLYASVALPDGTEVARRELVIAANEDCRVEIAVPQVPELALFRIASYQDTASPIVFKVNELVSSSSPSKTSASTPVKCVAWDLDGTLWRGTLSEGDDVRPVPEIVETIKTLDERGIVNSICSKNNAQEAMAKLRAFGIEELFVFPQISWNAKSVGLKRLAQEMNIGLDAIAFVDDREENRAEVRANAPEVRVFDEREAAGLASRLGGAGDALGSQRRVLYREEMSRRKASAQFVGDEAAFLAQSGLRFELLSVDGERITRCRELVQRTNQLTITARRYSEESFARLCANCETRAVHVWDKYGDYGIVGFVAWNDSHVIELVFSCRVAHKGIERKVLETLPKGLQVEVMKTDRNTPIREIVSKWMEERE